MIANDQVVGNELVDLLRSNIRLSYPLSFFCAKVNRGYFETAKTMIMAFLCLSASSTMEFLRVCGHWKALTVRWFSVHECLLDFLLLILSNN